MSTCQGCGAELLPSGGNRPRKWCSERCRRRTLYAGTCIDCGGPTDGSNGRARAPERCAGCIAHLNDERDARILEAWERGATGEHIAATEGLTYPQVRGVIEHRRRRHGVAIPLHRRPNRELWPVIEKRWLAGDWGTEIAADLGISQQNLSMMIQNMRQAGIDLPRVRRGGLPPGRKLAA